jgi:hypothetical protein
MKMGIKTVACCGMLLFSCACAYRHYLGMHGPSVRSFPDIHSGQTADRECLGCHHPDQDPEGPATSHPEFTGCLKCHNDEAM